MFAIKNFQTITAQLILYVSSSTTAITDYNVGSVTRTLLEGFAEELEYLYLEMFRGILEGVDTAVYNAFDFQPLPPVAASGLLTFSLLETGTTNAMAPTGNILIPAGLQVGVPSGNSTVVSGSAVSGTTYAVVQDTVWNAGQNTANVLAACTQAGSSGNTSANTITSILGTLPTVTGGTYAVTNPVSFNNGTDQESITAMKSRFSSFIQSLGRGTIDALEYAALQGVVYDANGNIIEKVVNAVPIEPYILDGSKPNGYVNIYIYNGTGNTSSTLVGNVQNIINGYYNSNGNRVPGYKAAGIIVTVLPVTQYPVNFSIQVVMNSGYTLTSSIQLDITNAIYTYVQSLQPGQSLLLNEIIRIVNSQESVYNCYIASPSADFIPSNTATVATISGVTINAVTELDITGETHT